MEISEYDSGYDIGYDDGRRDGFNEGYDQARIDYEDRLAKMYAEILELNARIDAISSRMEREETNEG